MSKISFLQTDFIIRDTKTWSVQLSRKREDSAEPSCSVNISLLGFAKYKPYAGQYAGRKLQISWEVNDYELGVCTFPILPSSDAIEYCDLVVVDYLRCQPGAITKATICFNPTSIVADNGYIFMRDFSTINIGSMVVSTWRKAIVGDYVIMSLRDIDGSELSSVEKTVIPNKEIIIKIYGKEPVRDNIVKVLLLQL